MDLKEFLKQGEHIDSVIERENFLATQALLFLGAEIFVLLNNVISIENKWDFIAVLILKISAVLFGGTLIVSHFLIMRLGYAKDLISSMQIKETNEKYDTLNGHIRFSTKAIPVAGNLWVIGLVLGVVSAIYVIFKI